VRRTSDGAIDTTFGADGYLHRQVITQPFCDIRNLICFLAIVFVVSR
jgi:hypothetical protein